MVCCSVACEIRCGLVGVDLINGQRTRQIPRGEGAGLSAPAAAAKQEQLAQHHGRSYQAEGWGMSRGCSSSTGALRIRPPCRDVPRVLMRYGAEAHLLVESGQSKITPFKKMHPLNDPLRAA